MLKRGLRWIYVLIVLPLTVFLNIVNVRLYYTTYDPQHTDVMAQLNFIKSALQQGAGEDTQQLFPEGYFFTHVLYGLAWVNLGLKDDLLQPQALTEARWVLSRLESPDGRAVFSETLDPPYGVFYVGWSNWLRGGILKLQSPESRNPAEVETFQTELAALAAAFDRSQTPFLAAYPRQSWPVDSTVAMAALRLRDNLFEPQFEATITGWLRQVQQRVDPATGLLPHRVDYQLGDMLEGARGSSQSIIQRFLPEIDPTWASQQYARFREQLVTNVFGIPGVREYPLGVEGQGDADSGPLVFGISFSASAVTAAAAQVQGDTSLADSLLNTGEALGMPLDIGGQKRYALVLLPVGDAFLAWAKSDRLWNDAAALPVNASPYPTWWRLPIHGITLVLLMLLWWPVWRHFRNMSN